MKQIWGINIFVTSKVSLTKVGVLLYVCYKTGLITRVVSQLQGWSLNHEGGLSITRVVFQKEYHCITYVHTYVRSITKN